MRPVPVLAVALLFATMAFASLPLAGAAADEAPWKERLFIDSGHAGAGTPFMAFDSTKRTFFDLDGDGILEIIAHNDNGKVYVLRGSDGVLLSEIATIHPIGWGARDINDVAVGDVDGNGRIDLVITNSVGYVTLYQLRKEQPNVDRFEWDRVWERKIDPRDVWPDIQERRPGYDWSAHFPGMDGSAYLADVDKSGKLTIFVQNDNMPGFFALNPDGSIRWAIDWSDGNASPWADDLNGDGRLEVVFVSDGGGVYVFDAATGSPRGTFHVKQAPGGCATRPGAISVTPGFADLDNDGVKEIIFGARTANGTEEDAASADWRQAQDARIYAVTPSGEMKWCFTADWMNPHVYMHPAVVDIDGDGRRDVIMAGWNTIGHKPGSWEVVNPPRLFALSADGNLLWTREMRVGWSNKDVVVADVDGDDKPEILAVDERGGSEGVVVLTLDGKEKGFITTRWGVSRGPQAVDLDGDEFLEIVVPVWRGAQGCTTSFDVGCREGALQVFSTHGKKAPHSGVFYFNYEYERVYDGKSPKKAAPPEKTETLQSGTLAGVVRDDDGPVPNARVVATVNGQEHETRSGEDGRYTLRAPAGTWQVRVRLFSHQEASAEVVVEAARLTARDFDLAERPVLGLLPNFLPAPILGVLGAMAAFAVGAVVVRRRRSTEKR